MSSLPDAAVLAASQARSEAVARAWRDKPAYRRLAEAFEGLDEDVEGAACVAETLLGNTDWVAPLLAPLIESLSIDPWAEPPLRLARDPLRTGAVLFACHAARLTATVLSADALRDLPAPRTIVLSGRLAVVRYHRAGGATLRRWEGGIAAADFAAASAPPLVPIAALALADGDVLRLDGRRCGHVLADARSDVNRRPKGTPYRRAKGTPFVEQRDGYDGRAVRAGCGVGRA